MRPIILLLLLALPLYGQDSLTYEALELQLADRYEAGDYAGAMAVAKDMERRYRDIDSFRGVALNDQALIHAAMGEYTEAEALYNEAIIVLRNSVGEEHIYYGNALNNLALLYEELGNVAAAEPLYKSALRIERLHEGKGLGYSISLNNLAELYRVTGRFTEAKPLYLEAISIQEAMPDAWYNYTISMGNLALLYEQLGALDKAVELHQRSLKIIAEQEGQPSSAYANEAIHLGRIYIGLDRHDEAEKLLKQGLNLRMQIFGDQHPQTLNCWYHLASLEERRGRHDEAARILRYALTLNMESSPNADIDWAKATFKYKFNAVEALFEYSNVRYLQYRQTNLRPQLQEAYAASCAAFKLNQLYRHEQEYEEDKLRTLQYSQKTLLQIIQHGLALGDKNYADWFAFAEQNKSTLLKDAINSSKARKFGDLPDSLARREIALMQQLQQLQHEAAEAKDKDSKAEIDKAIYQVQREQINFKRHIEKQYPRYYQLKYDDRPATLQEVQKALPQGALFLEFIIADTSVYLFAIDRDELKFHTLPVNKRDLNNRLTFIHNALSNYHLIFDDAQEAYRLYTQNARWLYTQLLAPALDNNKKYDQLLITTDGNLGRLPFEVLLQKDLPDTPIPYRELPYLLNSYTISYNYSATLWLENINKNLRPERGSILAVAADYTHPPAKHRNPRLHQHRRILRPLPYAQQEVEGISQIFSGSFLYGQNANEYNFKAQAHKYAVVHLAMHGLLDEHNYAFSSLAFSENNDTTHDNFLEIWEISQLELNAQLVVLSACETGHGQYKEGEGIMSLARAFMYAGSPAVIMSLWQVNDHSTNVLMQLFYLHLEEGMSKAQALRQAKLDYIRSAKGAAEHPAFWAAFVQLGDSRPVPLKGKKQPWSAFVLYAALAVALLAAFRFLGRFFK